MGGRNNKLCDQKGQDPKGFNVTLSATFTDVDLIPYLLSVSSKFKTILCQFDQLGELAIPRLKGASLFNYYRKRVDGVYCTVV